VERNSGRATLSNVSDLARGLGSASYTGISSGGNSKKRKADPEKVSMDTASVAGEKITLNKEVSLMQWLELMTRTRKLCLPISLCWDT
jgi:hypothetical protein